MFTAQVFWQLPPVTQRTLESKENYSTRKKNTAAFDGCVDICGTLQQLHWQ